MKNSLFFSVMAFLFLSNSASALLGAREDKLLSCGLVAQKASQENTDSQKNKSKVLLHRLYNPTSGTPVVDTRKISGTLLNRDLGSVDLSYSSAYENLILLQSKARGESFNIPIIGLDVLPLLESIAVRKTTQPELTLQSEPKLFGKSYYWIACQVINNESGSTPMRDLLILSLTAEAAKKNIK